VGRARTRCVHSLTRPSDFAQRWTQIAEFLRENAIATFLGLATLLISCRPALPVAERKALEVAMTAVLLATLSVVVACALVFQVLGQLALDELNLQLREHALQPRLVH